MSYNYGMGWDDDRELTAVLLASDRDYRFVCNCGAKYVERVQFCVSCQQFGTVYARTRREADRQLPSLRGMSARKLAATDQQARPLDAYPNLRWTPRSVFLLAGAAGQGKTTWAIRAGACLRPCVYFGFEEQLTEGFADKLRRLEVRYEDFYIEVPRTVSELLEVVREHEPRSIVIDSIQQTSLLARDARSLSTMIGGVVFAVSQVNRAGDVSGTAQWDHEADVFLRVEGMRYTATKNRFGQVGVEGTVL